MQEVGARTRRARPQAHSASLQYPSCRIEDCTEGYGEDSVSEELDDFTKQFRAAAVGKKATD